jgi:hypothetical protein
MSEQQPSSEPRIISEEIVKMQRDVARLCTAVRGLVQLVSALDGKVDARAEPQTDFRGAAFWQRCPNHHSR